MGNYKTYPHVSNQEARTIIKEICGNRQVYEKYYSMDDLLLFFLEPPNKYYSNSFAERGKAALVVNMSKLGGGIE